MSFQWFHLTFFLFLILRLFFLTWDFLNLHTLRIFFLLAFVFVFIRFYTWRVHLDVKIFGDIILLNLHFFLPFELYFWGLDLFNRFLLKFNFHQLLFWLLLSRILRKLILFWWFLIFLLAFRWHWRLLVSLNLFFFGFDFRKRSILLTFEVPFFRKFLNLRSWGCLKIELRV